jgi:hypothetical protein
MIVLASIEGSAIFAAIAALVGIINWLTKKDESSDAKKPSTPRTKAPRLGPRGDPAEEQMRRFLEALGVPADQRPPPPIQRRELPRVATVLPKIQPRGPIVSEPIIPSYTKKRAKLPEPPALRTPPPVEPPPMLQTQAEKVHFRELETPIIREFQTASSHVTAIPFEASHADMRDAYKTAVDLPTTQPSDRVRELLKSPAGLRELILLREIMGPPRGLPTGSSLPTFS